MATKRAPSGKGSSRIRFRSGYSVPLPPSFPELLDVLPRAIVKEAAKGVLARLRATEERLTRVPEDATAVSEPSWDDTLHQVREEVAAEAKAVAAALPEDLARVLLAGLLTTNSLGLLEHANATKKGSRDVRDWYREVVEGGAFKV